MAAHRSALDPLADIHVAAHDRTMSAVRDFLIDALQRVSNGGDIDDAALNGGVPNPLILDSDEKVAWEELSHWADDGDIRARDESYAAFKRSRMREHVASLLST